MRSAFGHRGTPVAWGLILALGGAVTLSACGSGGEGAEETPDAAAEAMAAGDEAGAGTETMETESDAGTQAAGLVNPNLAVEEELTGLSGMTDEALAAVLDERPFLDMLSLDAVLAEHLDAGAREALYGEMWVPVNLNTAPEAELLLIPGVGDRMAYEFDEYRPYDGMARFHREIGKYVDEETVARFAQYVFLPIDLNTATDEEILAIPGVGDRLLREFKEYRPYTSIEQFMREIGKYVEDDELARLARYVTLAEN